MNAFKQVDGSFYKLKKAARINNSRDASAPVSPSSFISWFARHFLVFSVVLAWPRSLERSHGTESSRVTKPSAPSAAQAIALFVLVCLPETPYGPIH